MSAVLEQETEIITAESGTLAVLNKSEIDMQIATAHKYPRSIRQFRNDVLDMVTLSEPIAQECIYALPRDGKVIEGPSARFAEVVASAWGNSRAGARVVNDQGDFVVAQGVFHDLQKNVAITYEVQRRITNKQGKRFGADMIGVTANAACSIALRNAILKGVPKAFWAEMYDAARRTAMGDVKTLPNRRADAFKAFVGYGITKEQIFAKLGVTGEEDIGQEELLVLRGLITAIKEGDTTPEQAFSTDQPGTGAPAQRAEKPAYAQDQFERSLPGWKKMIADGKKTADQVITMAESKAALSEEQKASIREAAAPKGSEKTDAASPALLNALYEKAIAAAINEGDICKHLQVESLEGITVAQVEQALKFIDNPV